MVAYAPIPADNRILFFRRDRDAFGFLSHFYPSPIVLDDMEWPTVEHFYQAHKSLDPRYQAAIRACDTPSLAKRRAATPGPGRKDRGSWFFETGKMPRPDWALVKADIMRRADLAKYSQNLNLADRLLATDDAEIIEDTRSDAFWGQGRDGAGENWAGRIIMEVRDALRRGMPQRER
jgi:ribA/ribD-fused uncharacterized protein